MSDDKTISILGTDVRIVTYKGEPVVTFAMVDAIHQRPDGTAGRTFRENRERFVLDEDFIKISADEIRRHKIIDLSPKAREDVTFLTRRGYLKLVKPLTDDRAWEVQGEMIDRYFMVEQIIDPSVARADFESFAQVVLTELLPIFRKEMGWLRGALLKAQNEKLSAPLQTLIDNHRTGVEFLNRKLRIDCVNGKETLGLIRDMREVLSQQAQFGARGSVSSYCTIRDAMQMIGLPDVLPAYRSMAAKAAKSLDAYCWRNGVVGETIDASGKAIRLYPKAAASDWALSEGRALLERHLAKHRTAPAVVRLPFGEKCDA